MCFVEARREELLGRREIDSFGEAYGILPIENTRVAAVERKCKVGLLHADDGGGLVIGNAMS